MMSNRKTKTPIKRVLIVATTLAGTAWLSSAYAEDATKIAAIDETASAQMADAADSDRRFDLKAYGDRFKLAITAIEEEARKPHWGWEACGEGNGEQVASNN
jgi:hypothetical protein